MDETYIKVGGRWVYLYRAVDQASRPVDFFLSPSRDVNAAKTFLRRAMEKTRKPTKITLDAYAASHRAVREMKEAGELSKRVRVRSSQYLNNLRFNTPARVSPSNRVLARVVDPKPATTLAWSRSITRITSSSLSSRRSRG